MRPTAPRGLELARQLPIHLAVVDVMMPVMDGITMVMKLRDEGLRVPRHHVVGQIRGH